MDEQTDSRTPIATLFPSEARPMQGILVEIGLREPIKRSQVQAASLYEAAVKRVHLRNSLLTQQFAKGRK